MSAEGKKKLEKDRGREERLSLLLFFNSVNSPR